MRAAEIALERQLQLAAAMIGPEVLVEVDVGDVSLHRLGELVAAERSAGEAALPQIRRLLEARPARDTRNCSVTALGVDPVCDMAVGPARARACAEHEGRMYYFCSLNCRETFGAAPGRYVQRDRPGAPR